MREYPAFLPHDGEHLALVITVPDEQPIGLVVLITGGSAARGHRFQLWTRAARRLADELHLASVRMDYRGTGDSTGALPEWHIWDLPVDQVMAAARFAMRATGVDRVAVAGNCIGSRVALEVAAELPECEGALGIRTPILQPSGLSDAISRARQWRFAGFLRSRPLLRRLLVRPLVNRKKRATGRVKSSIATALGRGRMLFLYSEGDFTFGEQVRRELDRIVASLPEEHRTRFELRMLTGGGLKGFESLDIQQTVLDTLVDWAAGIFGLVPSPATRAARWTGDRAGTP